MNGTRVSSGSKRRGNDMVNINMATVSRYMVRTRWWWTVVWCSLCIRVTRLDASSVDGADVGTVVFPVPRGPTLLNCSLPLVLMTRREGEQ